MRKGRRKSRRKGTEEGIKRNEAGFSKVRDKEVGKNASGLGMYI